MALKKNVIVRLILLLKKKIMPKETVMSAIKLKRKRRNKK